MLKISTALLAALIFAGSMVGCSAGKSNDEGHFARTFIPAPKGVVYDHLVWIDRWHELAFTRNAGGGLKNRHIYRMTLAGRRLRRVVVPGRPECRYTTSSFGAGLADGRLAYIRECFGAGAGANEQRDLMVLDPATGRSKKLPPYSLPFLGSYFAFAADGRRGIINDGHGLSEHLRWLGRKALSAPLRLGFSRVGFPAWSPDGKRLVVDAVPGTRSPPGFKSIGVARDLYLVSLDGKTRTRILGGLDSVAKPTWSPDSRQIAVALRPAGRPEGLYVFDLATRSLRLVMRGADLGAAAWLPDGRTLAVATGVFGAIPGSTPRPSGIFVIRLSP